MISSYGYEEVRLQPVRRPRSCLPTFYLSTHLLLTYLLTYLPAHFPPIYLPAHLPTYFLPTYRLPTSFLPTSYLLTHLPAYLPKANCLKALGLEFICTIRGLNLRSYEQLFHLQVSVEKKKALSLSVESNLREDSFPPCCPPSSLFTNDLRQVPATKQEALPFSHSWLRRPLHRPLLLRPGHLHGPICP